MTISVFVSYAREDQSFSDEIFAFLEQLGLDVFRDVDGLVGGESWHDHILRKAEEARLFIFLASSASINKPGMVQEELAIARRKLDTGGEFKFIVIRLDETTLQDWMYHRQFLEAQDVALMEKIVRATNDLIQGDESAIVGLSGKAFVNQRPNEVRYSDQTGCSYWYSIPSISIVGDRFAAAELNSAVRGRVAELVLNMKGWVAAEPRWQNENSMIVVTPIAVDVSTKYLALSFEHFAHFGSAAHGQHNFMTISLRRDPWSLKHVALRDEDRPRLIELVIAGIPTDEEMLWEHAELVESLGRFDFASHTVFLDSGVRIFFPDHVLGPYVMGPRVLDFAGEEIVSIMDYTDPYGDP